MLTLVENTSRYVPARDAGPPCPNNLRLCSSVQKVRNGAGRKSEMHLKRFIRRLAGIRGRNYLRRVGVLDQLRTGDAQEIPADFSDLCNLHRHVLRRKPRVILEFGTGFSTIVMAHALAQNGSGRLYGIDSSEHWIKNLQAKIPVDLAHYIDLRFSATSIGVHNGELCHYYDFLPNIVPDFIYLDAPASTDVSGSVRGLTFQPEDEGVRQQIAADILLYESTLRRGATILVDSRYNNVHFLKRNLKRRYRTRVNRTLRISTFELIEHTGRQ